MNERIRELATLAGYKDFDYAIIAHKFAELIVQECIHAVENGGGMCGVTSSNKIKEHFGVNE